MVRVQFIVTKCSAIWLERNRSLFQKKAPIGWIVQIQSMASLVHFDLLSQNFMFCSQTVLFYPFFYIITALNKQHNFSHVKSCRPWKNISMNNHLNIQVSSLKSWRKNLKIFISILLSSRERRKRLLQNSWLTHDW